MRNNLLTILLSGLILASVLAACGGESIVRQTATPPPEYYIRQTEMASGIGVGGGPVGSNEVNPITSGGGEAPPAVVPAPTALISFNPLPVPTLGNRTNEDVAMPPAAFTTPDPSMYDTSPPAGELTDLAMRVFGSQLPTRLIIPAIDLDIQVIPVGWKVGADGSAQWDSPGFAAGFVISSAAPGTNGNTVMYGHNNILGAVFKDLEHLRIGDEIFVLSANGDRYRYVIEGVDIILEAGITEEDKARNLAHFNPTSDTRLTLLTCWPFTNNTHRVVIVARPAG